MALYRRTLYKPLGPVTQPRMHRYDLVMMHTMVGTLTSTDRLFRRGGYVGPESHFGIGGPWGDSREGEVLQWLDTMYQSDAQMDGNRRTISIETADNFPQDASDILPWTPAQLKSIVEVTAWACRTHDIPAVLVPDSRAGRRGIAYHRLGSEHSRGVGTVPGFLVQGGERWSSARGKECPGPARISQMPEIVARVRDRLAGPAPVRTPAPSTPERKEPVTPESFLKHKVDLSAADARNMAIPGEIRRAEGDEVSIEYLLKWGGPQSFRILDELRELRTSVDKLRKEIEGTK